VPSNSEMATRSLIVQLQGWGLILGCHESSWKRGRRKGPWQGSDGAGFVAMVVQQQEYQNISGGKKCKAVCTQLFVCDTFLTLGQVWNHASSFPILLDAADMLCQGSVGLRNNIQYLMKGSTAIGSVVSSQEDSSSRMTFPFSPQLHSNPRTAAISSSEEAGRKAGDSAETKNLKNSKTRASLALKADDQLESSSLIPDHQQDKFGDTEQDGLVSSSFYFDSTHELKKQLDLMEMTMWDSSDQRSLSSRVNSLQYTLPLTLLKAIAMVGSNSPRIHETKKSYN
jgi:hypothetical protein